MTGMRRMTLVAIALCGMLTPLLQVAADADHDAMEEVVVTGARTGPRLWRISKAQHVLWLLGTPGALPKDVTWQAQDVEAVLSESELVISDVRVNASPSVFTLLPLYLQYRRIIRLPNKQTLRDWLSSESYQRYQTLKARYAPKEDWDGYRPLYVAEQLWRKAREQSGLNERVDVQRQVLKLAKQHHVNVQNTELDVEQPSKTLRSVFDELQQIPRDREVTCFEAAISTLQNNVDVLKARADAWALGDVDSLRQLQTGVRQACWEALSSSTRIEQLSEQLQQRWYGAATQALREHASTLALRSIDQLLGDHGVLAQFRADGYVVEGP